MNDIKSKTIYVVDASLKSYLHNTKMTEKEIHQQKIYDYL